MITDSLPVYFADFGVDGTLAGVAVRGLFDNDYSAAPLGERGMATTGPAFTLATASVPASPYGSALVVPAGTFQVIDHQPDGNGLSVLLLERAA